MVAVGRGVSDMANGFFATIFHKDKQAVERLHREVVRTSDRAINTANALSETIRGMVENNDRLTHRPIRQITNDPKKSS